ncbi:MAG: hypothetical protein RLZZ196_2788 [Bacteroidota bacterium]|jgi:hypothetical protein
MKNNITIEEQIDIELVLEEASAWGLRVEVEQTAKQYIDEGHSIVDSYHFAYEDWIK